MTQQAVIPAALSLTGNESGARGALFAKEPSRSRNELADIESTAKRAVGASAAYATRSIDAPSHYPRASTGSKKRNRATKSGWRYTRTKQLTSIEIPHRTRAPGRFPQR